jgi:uncharacterized protein YdbL (DUF1318 family)
MNLNLKNTFKILVVLFSVNFVVSHSFALDLDSARRDGLVRELPNGFLEAVNPKAKDLADTINSKRKDAYLKISKETGVDLDLVGSQAAEKIKMKLSTGN